MTTWILIFLWSGPGFTSSATGQAVFHSFGSCESARKIVMHKVGSSNAWCFEDHAE